MSADAPGPGTSQPGPAEGSTTPSATPLSSPTSDRASDKLADATGPQLSGGPGNGGSGSSPGGSGDGDDSDDVSHQAGLARAQETSEGALGKFNRFKSSASEFGSAFSTNASAFVKTVPAPVTVALFSSVTTIVGSRVKARRDKKVAKNKAIAAARLKKAEIEEQLRQLYGELATPMLKSATKLAERLYTLTESDISAVEDSGVKKSASPLYSAYLLGRYLATVEILKKQSTVLDYGFPAADRIMANILGRIQGILCANDRLLIEMQNSENFFQPGPGDKPLKAGPLKIPPRRQTVMGELLLRRLWKEKYDFVDDIEDAKELKRGPAAYVTFLEFTRLMEKDATMRQWYQPVVEEFESLQNRIARSSPGKSRRENVGARVFFLQSGLLDLVEFFDPLPNAKSVPFYRRRRLQIGPQRYKEEQRQPPSLLKLFSELANVRDHRVVEGDAMERLRLPHKVDVFVEGVPGAGDANIHKFENGDDPHSHRVLITLHEMGIPHSPVVVAPYSKPAWYYLIHPENKTPCIYHDGHVVEESGNIVSYLMKQFPDAKKLAGINKLQLSKGTPGYTKFYPNFVRWVRGDETAKRELEAELVLVNKTIETAQLLNEGKPFLGGESFSREDTAIAPMLHNIEVAGRKMKGWQIPDECGALKKYLEQARKVPSFAETVGRDDVIVEGYERMKANGRFKAWQPANMLD